MCHLFLCLVCYANTLEHCLVEFELLLGQISNVFRWAGDSGGVVSLALHKMEDKAREEATHITTVDRLSQQLGALKGPQNQTQLMVALEFFIVALHDTWGLKESRQKQDVAIRHILLTRYTLKVLLQKMCLGIYWAIFMDSRASVAVCVSQVMALPELL